MKTMIPSKALEEQADKIEALGAQLNGVTTERNVLRHELEVTRTKLANLQACHEETESAVLLTELRAEKAEQRAARLEAEMRMHLPILEALESKLPWWDYCTRSTGVATLAGYRQALRTGGSDDDQ